MSSFTSSKVHCNARKASLEIFSVSFQFKKLNFNKTILKENTSAGEYMF